MISQRLSNTSIQLKFHSQKSVNALVAVRRLSSISSLMNMKTRPSVVPALATVPSCEEEGESEDNKTEDNDPKEQEKVDKKAEKVNSKC